MLKFQKGTSAKVKKIAEWYGKPVNVYSFSLPAGWSCPQAEICLSKADKITGKITDGKKTTIRCYAASDEAKSPNARRARWHNFDILKGLEFESIYSELFYSFPDKADIMRIHVGGDFYNQKYFDAWVFLAQNKPDTTFYAYTKSIPYWVSTQFEIPQNLKLIASTGGRSDELISEYNLREATIVLDLEEADMLELDIDHDESIAIKRDDNFALLIHGTQPKGSKSSQAISALKKNGVAYSYGR